MPQQLETGIGQQVIDVAFDTGKEVIHAEHFIALFQKFFAQTASQKTASACYKNTFHRFY